jgi:transposase
MLRVQFSGGYGGAARTRRISIVAFAHKLLIALSRYVNHGEIPAGAVMKAV